MRLQNAQQIIITKVSCHVNCYAASSYHASSKVDLDGQEGIVKVQKAPLVTEITIMFRRHLQLIVRDPILYVGRCAIFVLMCLVFALVYLTHVITPRISL